MYFYLMWKLTLISIFIVIGNVTLSQGLIFNNSNETFESIRKQLSNDPTTAEEQVRDYYIQAFQSTDKQWQLQASILRGDLEAALSKKVNLEAISYYNKALALSRELNQPDVESEILTAIAFVFKNKIRDRDSATHYFNQALNLSLKHRHYLGIVKARTGLAYLEMDSGNYPQALERLLQNRLIIDSTHSLSEKGRLQNNIGHVYMKLGLNEDAIWFFQNAYEYYAQADAQAASILAKLNEAQATLGTGKTKRTFEILDEVLKLNQEDLPVAQRVFYYAIMGRAFLIKGDYESALSSFKKGQKLGYQSLDMNTDLARALREVGQVEAAHRLLMESLKATKKDQMSLTAKNSELYLELSKVNEVMNKPDSALYYLQEYLDGFKEIHDQSIISQSLLREMRQRLAYQENESKLEKAYLNQRLETEKNQRSFILIVSVLMGLIIFILIIIYKQKHHNMLNLARKNEILEKQKTEIETQARLLEEANEKFYLINDKLNKMVTEKTNEVMEKNKILDEYAFINSHKLRSPIAAIKGIVDVLPYTENEQKEELLREIIIQANRLDKIVYEIRDLLEFKSELLGDFLDKN